MAKNWYPIINSKCNLCKKCIQACPENLINFQKNQILLNFYEKCIENCKKCSDVCEVKAINYFDGTNESLINSFKGVCTCH